ncbi:hypothetical protein BASA50_004812 [Batrachochytrium salamandrivorans]|uniref:Extracellular metalloproteinase n=1 Tax=Batrachochytrium salamandrivorans TaxID=1357716 RepID=A0ABQ8FG47_9FUNG|nr:hypothetical protein BASA50_004812 [Batrachochytrium salamandrivorans]
MATKGVFGGIFDPLLPPQTPKNLVTGAVNAFYVTNMVHDVLYQYGFTELAGNYQKNNFDKGGKGEDSVIINVQNSERENSAYFDTFPDGQSGVIDLHIYTTTNPNRDPALDNTVMIHELTHGLSSRLTGGAQTKLLYWNLVEAYGFSANLHDATQEKGNIIFLQLLVGTLMIQPCNPTFDSAYDAMLAADDAYYGGIHKHLIRKGFAKRGLDPVS